MYVNIYLWNAAVSTSFEEAKKCGEILLTCKYVQKGSEHYLAILKTIKDSKEILHDDYLTLEEVPFSQD